MDFLKGFNWVVVLGILVAIETQIGNGTMSLANMVPETWIPYVKAWAANLGSVGALIMSAGAFGPRPQGQFTVTPAAKSAIILAVLLGGSLMVSGEARAQAVRKPQLTGDVAADARVNLGLDKPARLTGNLEQDAKAVWDKIVKASNADLEYASKMAESAGTNGSKVRKQCWDAIIAANKQANGMNVLDASGNPLPKPDPQFFTSVESLAETIDNLSPQGPLFTSCAGAAQLAKTNVLTLINAVVTGAAGFAAMPIIPGL